MPGPLVAAAGAGLGSAIIGASAAKSASNAQVGAAKDQMALQSQMFNRTDQLQEQLFNDQQDQLLASRSENIDLASGERNALAAANRGLYDQSRGIAGKTYADNMAHLRGARGASLNQVGVDRRANIAELQSGRDNALAGFQPYLDQGQAGLGAYAYNLGIGDQPDNYSGLSLSPGAQFQLEEGRKAVEGGAAGRGGLLSGNTLASLERMRNGYVSMDRDNQMAQLFGLAGMGQNAAGAMGNINMNAADAIAGQRNYSTSAGNALRSGYADAMIGQRNQNLGVMDSINSRYYGGNQDIATQFANRGIGFNTSLDANMGNARANRANLQGANAAGFTSNASQTLGNMGDARAAGSMGVANALSAGFNTGFGTYGMMGGTFPTWGQGQMQPQQAAQVASGYRPMPKPWG